ncbi:MAG TPA: hypothetical protein VGR71_13580 [Nitrospira sp.]|nr:hypothetical protein [Nitrospira sp.]
MANRGDVHVPVGQTLQQICNNQAHAEMTSCISRCSVCVGTVMPDFMLLSILYAPPGDKSTNSFGKSKTAGTQETTTDNFN